MKTQASILAFLLALSGCARVPERSQDLDAPRPSDEERLRRTLDASEQGPSQWSPAITIPLLPVLLVADTAIKFTKATVGTLWALFGGEADEELPLPERLKRQAEKLPKN